MMSPQVDEETPAPKITPQREGLTLLSRQQFGPDVHQGNAPQGTMGTTGTTET